MDAPKYGARCSPLMKPSTTFRASRSRLPIRARIFGSTKRAPARGDIGTPAELKLRATHSRGAKAPRYVRGVRSAQLQLRVHIPDFGTATACSKSSTI